jgi:hypothetical protein
LSLVLPPDRTTEDRSATDMTHVPPLVYATPPKQRLSGHVVYFSPLKVDRFGRLSRFGSCGALGFSGLFLTVASASVRPELVLVAPVASVTVACRFPRWQTPCAPYQPCRYTATDPALMRTSCSQTCLWVRRHSRSLRACMTRPSILTRAHGRHARGSRRIRTQA